MDTRLPERDDMNAGLAALDTIADLKEARKASEAVAKSLSEGDQKKYRLQKVALGKVLDESEKHSY